MTWLECRRSILGISVARSDKPNHPRGGLDGADKAFVTFNTESSDRRSVRQDHTSESETCFKGSWTKGARVLHVTLAYITSVCLCREGKNGQQAVTRDKKPSQKEIRRELPSISKAMHIPSGQSPPASLLSWALEEPCAAHPTLVSSVSELQGGKRWGQIYT